MVVEVAEALEGDADDFAAFLGEAWREAGPGAPGFAGATDDVVEELMHRDAILARIGAPARRMFLARRGGRVVGFAATKGIDDGVAELAGVIVLRPHAGGGIGTMLVEAARDRARADGYRRMRVSTEESNDRARRFYEARGFVITGTAT